jgi:hypothetical protein
MIGKEPRFWTVWFDVGDITRDNFGKASKALSQKQPSSFLKNRLLHQGDFWKTTYRWLRLRSAS